MNGCDGPARDPRGSLGGRPTWVLGAADPRGSLGRQTHVGPWGGRPTWVLGAADPRGSLGRQTPRGSLGRQTHVGPWGGRIGNLIPADIILALKLDWAASRKHPARPARQPHSRPRVSAGVWGARRRDP